ncbi:A24 family peptidase [Candidatus Woesearchaeota archaeon]|nr:A24 family peptidase [Candidatus Woesearchaeota archaeon]MBW3005827.1 A24 family peptidase [Candidatus Woesearchaeota archaeon]
MIGLIYGVCLFLLVIGTFTDLKVREVPDWLNYSGIFVGLGLRLIWSFYSFDWSYIIHGLVGFGVFFGLACLMFYLGQWGGGDAKMLMALGALLGLELSFESFTVGFLVSLMIVGGLYGFAWSAVLAARNWKKFSFDYRKVLAEKRKYRVFFLGFSFVLLVSAVFVSDVFTRFLLVFFALFVPAMNYLVFAVKAVENSCMYQRVKPSELTEGDWIAKDVKVKGKRICGPKDLGIEKKQIRKLVKLKVKSVVVKTGIPFVPSFLMAFLLTLWIGNPFVYLL